MIASVMEETKTLSRREAGTMLGVHYNTIRAYEAKGLLSPIRVVVGGIEEVRYTVEEVRALTEDVALKRRRSGGELIPSDVPPEQRDLYRRLQDAQSDNTRLRIELAQCESERDMLRELNQELRSHIETIKELARSS